MSENSEAAQIKLAYAMRLIFGNRYTVRESGDREVALSTNRWTAALYLYPHRSANTLAVTMPHNLTLSEEQRQMARTFWGDPHRTTDMYEAWTCDRNLTTMMQLAAIMDLNKETE